jgi:transposase
MSASLIYHAFGVRGYRYVKTGYVEGEVVFTIVQPRESYRRPVCGSDDVIGRGQRTRRFRSVSIGVEPVCISLSISRVGCRSCGALRQVKLGFADPRVSYTKAFERYTSELSQYMTIKDVAEHLGISWDVIKEIQKGDLRRRFDRPKLKRLRQIAIDEISTAKGHVCLTIVLDLESGAVGWHAQNVVMGVVRPSPGERAARRIASRRVTPIAPLSGCRRHKRRQPTQRIGTPTLRFCS